MSAVFSTLARNGSNTSASSSGSSAGLSNNHMLSQIHSSNLLPTWMQEAWQLQTDHRYERIATGTMRLGMAVLTREMMEMHVHQAPDVRGMLDCLPVAHREDAMFVGWRKKLPTWPISKNEVLTLRWF